MSRLYRIVVRETRVVESIYRVRADSREAAIDIFHDGDGDWQDDDIIDTLEGPNIESIEDISPAPIVPAHMVVEEGL